MTASSVAGPLWAHLRDAARANPVPVMQHLCGFKAVCPIIAQVLSQALCTPGLPAESAPELGPLSTHFIADKAVTLSLQRLEGSLSRLPVSWGISCQPKLCCHGCSQPAPRLSRQAGNRALQVRQIHVLHNLPCSILQSKEKYTNSLSRSMPFIDDSNQPG